MAVLTGVTDAFRGKFQMIDLAPIRNASWDQMSNRNVMHPAVRVTLGAVAATAEPREENEAFYRATPYGKIEMLITNDRVAGELMKAWVSYCVGESTTPPTFFVDFSRVPEMVPA